MLEYQVGRDLSHHLVQPFLQKHDLDKISQHPLQPNFKGVQCWRIHHFPEIIPMAVSHCSHCENFPLVSNWDLPRSNLCPWPLIFSVWLLVKKKRSLHLLCSHPVNTLPHCLQCHHVICILIWNQTMERESNRDNKFTARHTLIWFYTGTT